MSRVWENLIVVPKIQAVLEEAGGVVQPLAFGAARFEVYADMLKP